MLFQRKETCSFDLLRYNFKEIKTGWCPRSASLQLQEDKICYLQPALLQTQGGKAGDFNMLHCNFRKTRFVVFSLLHCKLRDVRLVSSIRFTANLGRQDLLSSVCSTANSGMPDWYLRSACCKLKKTRSAIFSMLHYKLKDARLVSSIRFAANSGRQDLLSSVYSTANSGMSDWYLRSALLQTQKDKICNLQSAPLQTQGCQTGIFDPLHCKLRKTRSVNSPMLLHYPLGPIL
ncbi:hypothetical protein J1N35_005819 [Gossypium stocksii]|uniref:Uncharacterized protein n=1 Tax=Gossypium stocksii TaxID=47602 RepID=A0A9D4AIZ1_9ROSI|nr:hypothetical protein J1N35_005819 [Gossypium stocksii]